MDYRSKLDTAGNSETATRTFIGKIRGNFLNLAFHTKMKKTMMVGWLMQRKKFHSIENRSIWETFCGFTCLKAKVD